MSKSKPRVLRPANRSTGSARNMPRSFASTTCSTKRVRANRSWCQPSTTTTASPTSAATPAKTPRATSQAGAHALIPPPLVEVNEGKIAELQNRIEQLQREQLVAQNALTQQTRVLAAGAGETGPAVAPGTAPATERVEDP